MINRFLTNIFYHIQFTLIHQNTPLNLRLINGFLNTRASITKKGLYRINWIQAFLNNEKLHHPLTRMTFTTTIVCVFVFIGTILIKKIGFNNKLFAEITPIIYEFNLN